MRTVVGLDFGTTNSAIAIATPSGMAQLALFPEGNQQTTMFRSLLYFDPENLEPTGKPRAIGGPDAIAHYLQAATRGRLIQSMKSHLGSPLFKHTVIFNSTFTLEELIAILIRMLKEAAEAQFGDLGDRVVVGRPADFCAALRRSSFTRWRRTHDSGKRIGASRVGRSVTAVAMRTASPVREDTTASK